MVERRTETRIPVEPEDIEIPVQGFCRAAPRCRMTGSRLMSMAARRFQSGLCCHVVEGMPVGAMEPGKDVYPGTEDCAV
jgi:hypothetical protein